MKQRAVKTTEIIKLAFLTLAIITLGLFVFKTEAIGKTSEEAQQEYYNESEDIYRDNLRAALSAHGFDNAGINITCFIYADRSRSVNVSIHHDRVQYMDEDEKEAFMNILSQIQFTDMSIPVSYSLF